MRTQRLERWSNGTSAAQRKRLQLVTHRLQVNMTTSAATWQYPEGTKLSTVSTGGRRKCHYTLPDESEVVEEYDLQTDELLVRKKRGKSVLGALQEWVFEIGEAPARATIEGDMMRVSSTNPTLVRKDRPHVFEWRIRNLSYPKATYNVSVDTENNQIVVRTANKKYFKRIDVEELDRARVPLEEASLTWDHENSTLIIQYKKPAEIVKKEREAKIARLNAPEVQAGADANGADPAECKQQ